MTRLEFWVDFNEQDAETKTKLQEELKQKLIEDPEIGGKLEKDIKWSGHQEAAFVKK